MVVEGKKKVLTMGVGQGTRTMTSVMTGVVTATGAAVVVVVAAEAVLGPLV